MAQLPIQLVAGNSKLGGGSAAIAVAGATGATPRSCLRIAVLRTVGSRRRATIGKPGKLRIPPPGESELAFVAKLAKPAIEGVTGDAKLGCCLGTIAAAHPQSALNRQAFKLFQGKRGLTLTARTLQDVFG